MAVQKKVRSHGQRTQDVDLLGFWEGALDCGSAKKVRSHGLRTQDVDLLGLGEGELRLW